MELLTNWIFWAIIVAIVIVMAIIGYLAEGTALGSKKSRKKQGQANTSEVNEINTEDAPAPSAWTGEVKAADKTHEQIHEVPTAEDWTTLPTTSPETVAAAPQVGNEETLFNEKAPENKEPEVSIGTNMTLNEALAKSTDSPSAPQTPADDVPEVINLDDVAPVLEPVTTTTEASVPATPQEVAPTLESAPISEVAPAAPTPEPAPVPEAPMPTEQKTEQATDVWQ